MTLHLQVACESAGILPRRAQVETWVGSALAEAQTHGSNPRGNSPEKLAGELTVRLVDEPEMADLNQRYRNRTGPTDVLSFPFDGDELPDFPQKILGDIAICPPVVIAYADSQGIPALDHWAHVVIHGTLHLCGFDHQHDTEAEEMESLERAILGSNGIRWTPPAKSG